MRFPSASADFKLEEPYDGARYDIAVPIDFASGKHVPLQVDHPWDKFVGRRVRREVTVKRKVRGQVIETIERVEGIVKKFSPQTSLFKIVYDERR